MKLITISPFKTKIRLDRKWLTYNSDSVAETLSLAKRELSGKDIDIGLNVFDGFNNSIIYKNKNEPGLGYRSAHLFEKIIINGDLLDFHDEDFGLIVKRAKVVYFDHCYANLIIEFDCNFKLNQVMSIEQIDGSLISQKVQDIFKEILNQIEDLEKEMETVNYIETDTAGAEALKKSNSRCVVWAHRVWCLELNSDVEAVLKLATTLDPKYFDLALTDGLWGVGESVITIREPDKASIDPFKSSWLEGVLIAQFYYAQLDEIVRAFPFFAEHLRQDIARGRLGQAIKAADLHSNYVGALLIEYATARQIIAGSTQFVFCSLMDKWQAVNLIAIISNQIPYLSQISSQALNKVQRWSQASIESVLYVVTMIGMFSLAISLHDYLLPGKQQYGIDALRVPSNLDPLTLAGYLLIVSLIFYLSFKSGGVIKLIIFLVFNIKKFTRRVMRYMRTYFKGVQKTDG